MYLYNYEILDNISQEPLHNNVLLLKENNSLIIDSSFIMKLHNNQYRQVAITSNKTFSNISVDQQVNFLVQDVVTFSSKVNSSIIEYKIHKKGNKQLVKYWLSHTFLPILFTIENKYYFLHAGAVELANKSVLFIANSFGGKSTLTDYFIKKGHSLISDDKVGTFIKDDSIMLTPSYPFHRPYRKIEDLGFYVENFLKKTMKMNIIFNLVKSDEKSDINITELKGIEKFKVLRLASDIDLSINKKDRFEILSKIAKDIYIYNINVPWDLNRLEEVYIHIKNFLKEKNES